MELKEINYIIAIDDYHSISKAAEILYISQPSLSNYLSVVEKRIGDKLFMRTKKGLHLTESGEIYLGYAREIKKLYDSMQTELEKIQKKKNSRISVGMTLHGSIEDFYIIEGEFSKKYPDCHIDIRLVLSRDVPHLLNSGDINFAIASYLGDMEFRYLNLRKDKILLIAHQDYADKLEDLAEEREGLEYPWVNCEKIADINLILQDVDCQITSDIKGQTELFVSNCQVMTVANSLIAIHAVEKRMGICFISETFLGYVSNPEEIRCYCVGDPVLYTSTNVVCALRKEFSSQEKYLIELIKGRLG